MKKSAPPRIKKFPAAKQRLLDTLLEKNSQGAISEPEKVRLEALVGEAERLMVANAKILAQFSQSEMTGPPPTAVPVTVWVHSDPVSP